MFVAIIQQVSKSVALPAIYYVANFITFLFVLDIGIPDWHVKSLNHAISPVLQKLSDSLPDFPLIHVFVSNIQIEFVSSFFFNQLRSYSSVTWYIIVSCGLIEITKDIPCSIWRNLNQPAYKFVFKVWERETKFIQERVVVEIILHVMETFESDELLQHGSLELHFMFVLIRCHSIDWAIILWDLINLVTHKQIIDFNFNFLF